MTLERRKETEEGTREVPFLLWGVESTIPSSPVSSFLFVLFCWKTYKNVFLPPCLPPFFQSFFFPSSLFLPLCLTSCPLLLPHVPHFCSPLLLKTHSNVFNVSLLYFYTFFQKYYWFCLVLFCVLIFLISKVT